MDSPAALQARIIFISVFNTIGLFQLRYLQTLNSISAENNSTIVFPVPIDTLAEFMSYNQQHHQQQLPYNPNWGSPQPPNWTQQQQQNLDGPIPPAPTHKPPPPLKPKPNGEDCSLKHLIGGTTPPQKN